MRVPYGYFTPFKIPEDSEVDDELLGYYHVNDPQEQIRVCLEAADTVMGIQQ